MQLITHTPREPTSATLRHLLKEKGITRWGVFFATGEGHTMPNGEEEASGYIIDPTGHIHSYWIGWDPDRRAPRFTEWEENPPEAHWQNSPEYRAARQAAGIDN